MARYSENVIEQIRNRLSVSEVVSSYVRLTKKGDRHWGLCPFHHEKTASFTVLDSGGFFKCFGCGKGGSMFDFVMEMEHCDFSEAVEILAKKAGVELKKESEEEKAKLSEEKAMTELYNRLQDYYHRYLLQSSEGQTAREYIKNRNISAETLEKFKLGFASDNPALLYNLLKDSYSEEFLVKTGLFNRDYKTYPFFKNRIVFPLRNTKGDCVGFSGRDMSGDPKAAKYKNSMDSSIYSKKNMLFGFFESLNDIKKKGEVILCEGNFDVISLHQAGLSWACAPLGTSFTEQQAALLRRYCSKVTLLFDSDNAGQKATAKALLLCQKNDLENFVIKPFPNAKDSSEVIEKEGEKSLADYCVNTVTGFSYLVSLALKMYDIRQPKGKTSVFKEVKPYLDATSSEIERQVYIKYLSDRIGISEEYVADEYRKQRSALPETITDDKPEKDLRKPLEITPDLNTLLFLVNNRSLFDSFRRQIKINTLEDSYAQMLYTVLEDAEREGIKTNEIILQMISDEMLKAAVVSSFDSSVYKSENPEKAVQDFICRKKLRLLENKRDEIMRLISTSDLNSLSKDELTQLLETKGSLDREIEENRRTDLEDNII